MVAHFFRHPMMNSATGKIFISGLNKKNTYQNIGLGSIRNVPKNVATILNLPDPEKYKGHSLRRTAATLAANTGMSVEQIKMLTDHLSDKVVHGYVSNSEDGRSKIAASLSAGTNNLNNTISSNFPMVAPNEQQRSAPISSPAAAMKSEGGGGNTTIINIYCGDVREGQSILSTVLNKLGGCSIDHRQMQEENSTYYNRQVIVMIIKFNASL